MVTCSCNKASDPSQRIHREILAPKYGTLPLPQIQVGIARATVGAHGHPLNLEEVATIEGEGIGCEYIF